jgi:hypothetical protein
MIDLTEAEQENVRIAMRALRYRAGRWKLVAKALGFTPRGIRNVSSGAKAVSIKAAFRVARMAQVSLEELLSGRFPPSGTCPKCGHHGG